MGSKVHVHMQVSDLTKSPAFYERFFGGAPVKMKPATSSSCRTGRP